MNREQRLNMFAMRRWIAVAKACVRQEHIAAAAQAHANAIGFASR